IRSLIAHTLDQMALGGMYDLIDGGFCRYSTDEAWLVPHFEKMTYDNALLCSLYAKAGIVYGEEKYLQTARECADFMMNFMMEDDLFYSASDADSEGEEGKYFVYSYDEIIDVMNRIGVPDTQQAAKLVGASPEGNFEGHCIIRLSSSRRPEWFEPFKEELRRLRRERLYPFIDRKIITAWNAMMIKALFVLGKSDGRYTQQGKNTLAKLTASMSANGVLKHSTLIHKEAKIDAFLEDYAYLCSALIEAYQATLEEAYLIEAQRFANKALELYYEEGKWYFSRGTFTTVGEIDDGTYPSAMAVMVASLLSLGLLIDDKYRRFAFKSLEYISLKLMKTPIYYPTLTAQAIRWLNEERLVKATSERLLQLRQPFSYPFVLLKNDETLENFLICGQNACFSTTDDAGRIDEILRSTL
ncbi:MAG: thioredoxin domain-containing protein, partial [Campylobacterales bacterium]|nr:thioredoxin domain-containing protein [Campylobacterales bacterium]